MSSKLSPDIFRTILQEVNLSIRVVDPNSHEIVWMNELAEKGRPETKWQGEKCHKIFHGLETPCPSCPKSKVSENEFYKWQQFSPRLGKHLEFSSKLFKVDNQVLWLDIVEDISERVQKQERLQELYENDHILAQVLHILTSNDKKYDIFEKALALACKQYQADRALIFLYDEDIDGKEKTISCAHEWCAEDVLSQKDDLQYVPITYLPMLFDFLNGSREIIIENVEQIRNDHPPLYEILTKHGVSRFFAIPIYRNNDLVGIITIDNAKSKFHDLTTLMSIAIFAGADRAPRAEAEHLQKIGMIDSLTSAGSKDAFLRRKNILENNVDHRLGVIYADLNNLKLINDTQGRGRGDLFLQSISGLFLQYFRASDVFRLGDDDFIFLCSGISETHFYEKVRLLITDCEKRFPKRIAFGTLWQENPTSVESMLEEVDRLMYADKQLKKKQPKNDLFKN